MGPGRPAVLQLLREPTLPILLMAFVAMVRRAYVPDICLVGGTVALIVLDCPRWRLRTGSAQPSGATIGPPMLALTAAAAAVMASFPDGPGALDVPFALVGLVMLREAWWPGGRLARGTGPVAAPRRWWLWPALGVTLALVELFSFVHQSAPMVDNPRHPTLSTVVEPHLAAWPVRAVAPVGLAARLLVAGQPRARLEPGVSSADVTVAAFLAVGLLAVAVQLLALRHPERVAALGDVLTWAMRRRSAQLGLMFAWWWVGWHFLTAR